MPPAPALPPVPDPSGPPPATLADWRRAPQNAWAFSRVRELIPTAEIAAGPARPLEEDWCDLAAVPLPETAAAEGAGEIELGRFLVESHTNAFVALRAGRLVWEWHGGDYDGLRPHLLFSVSKSLTGLVAGALAARGALDPDRAIAAYVPEIEGSAYDGARVRDLLDMTVSTAFDETYLAADGDYGRYRVATAWNPAPPGEAPDLRGFLATLPPGEGPHGRRFRYVSPNSDLLGWVLERAAGARYADLLSEILWRPIGLEAPGYVTMDGRGAARSGGGVCARPRDLARIGEAVRRRGIVPGGAQVLPGAWLDDMAHGGDRAAWTEGDMADLFPAGRYRAQWYQSGLPSGAIAAIGIHGQWLWIDPSAEVVLVKLSAQPVPDDDVLDQRTIAALDALSAALA